MALITERIGPDKHHLYNKISSRFLVKSVYMIEEINHGLGGLRLLEAPVEKPYFKNYDADGKEIIAAWAEDFNINDWGIFLCCHNDEPVGGITVAINSKIYPLDRFQREDMAVLWDIRISPDVRGKGIGKHLFYHAAGWARSMGCGQLAMETQNVNVYACNFYSSMGCRLGAIHRYGYSGCPNVKHEAMLLWYYDL
jgi:GNAT superfamily N-acetyltransferase